MPEQDDKISAPEDAVEDLELADEDADKVVGGTEYLKVTMTDSPISSY